MLIKHGTNRIVNLTNVSNIFIEEDKKKVIFNMNYSVKIFGGKYEQIEIIEAKDIIDFIENPDGLYPKTKTITNVIQEAKYTPDYTYWEYETEAEKNQIKTLIEAKLRETSWIFPENDALRYVNLDCVSSISYDDYKNRVIFNLNYPVTHPKDNHKLTSDYVFWNFYQDRETYNKVVTSFEFLANKI